MFVSHGPDIPALSATFPTIPHRSHEPFYLLSIDCIAGNMGRYACRPWTSDGNGPWCKSHLAFGPSFEALAHSKNKRLAGSSCVSVSFNLLRVLGRAPEIQSE